MVPSDTQLTTRRSHVQNTQRLRRRHFLALGASVGAAAIAGCSTRSGLFDGGDSNGTAEATGTFRLLISDQPVAIDAFDELNVSFDRARVFRDGDDDLDDEVTETETETKTETETETQGGDDEDDGDEDEDGFMVIDLGGATVDLTQVVGERAIGVFDGEIPAGRYTKIELYATRVDGIVDGESVDVKIPSEKLQIVKPFEVVAGQTLTFVFDISVVRRGPTGGYNLLPVISKSGVAGEDVEVEEVGDADDDGDGEESESPDVDDEDGQGPPENVGPNA